MPNPLDDALLATIEARATEMARGAGAILASYFGKPMDVEYKDKKERDPVTAADKQSQDYLAKNIAGHFPDHGILGEEDGEQPDAPAPDFVWVLDPLDGTRNFLSGLPIYACSIGVLCQGVPVVGAVFIPWPCEGGGVVLHARSGGGAFVDQRLISVLKSSEPKGNRLTAVPVFFGAAHRFRRPMRGKAGELRVTGSIAYELAMVARGVLQYSVTTSPHLWDVAGGALLVAEAGGLVMQRQRAGGVKALLAAPRWEPMASFFPSWRSGVTTMKELRHWSDPLAFGGPDVVRYVTSNLRRRLLLRRRLARAARRLVGSRKRD